MQTTDTQDVDLTDSRQYLTFILEGEEYAIDILKVQEIRGFESTTKIPNTPDYVLGVINLRGSVVPVVDLRIKFNLSDANMNSNTVTILVKIPKDSGERTVGIVVDAVSDVHAISPDDIAETPYLASGIARNFVTGLATKDSKMIIMLEIESLISTGILDEDKSQEDNEAIPEVVSASN